MGADAHLPRPHPPLCSRATLYLARGQQGCWCLWCVSCLFLIPVHSFVSPPPLRLGSWWLPGSPVRLVSYLSLSLLSLGETSAPGGVFICAGAPAPEPQLFPSFHLLQHIHALAQVWAPNMQSSAPPALRAGPYPVLVQRPTQKRPGKGFAAVLCVSPGVSRSGFLLPLLRREGELAGNWTQVSWLRPGPPALTVVSSTARGPRCQTPGLEVGFVLVSPPPQSG